MSSILLMVLIIISLTAIFCSSVFRSGIKNPQALEPLCNRDLSDSKQFNLSELDESLCIIKSSRNKFIQKQPFPQR
jgi:hypothetical protein